LLKRNVLASNGAYWTYYFLGGLRIALYGLNLVYRWGVGGWRYQTILMSGFAVRKLTRLVAVSFGYLMHVVRILFSFRTFLLNAILFCVGIVERFYRPACVRLGFFHGYAFYQNVLSPSIPQPIAPSSRLSPNHVIVFCMSYNQVTGIRINGRN
jgi:hypothetical protein